ncbi:MAG: hypothetical protein AAGI46_14960, partial [Planctomycetota bacterium]
MPVLIHAQEPTPEVPAEPPAKLPDTIAEAIDALADAEDADRRSLVRRLTRADDAADIELVTQWLLAAASPNDLVAWLTQLNQQSLLRSAWVPTLERLLLNTPRPGHTTTTLVRRLSAAGLATIDTPEADAVLALAAGPDQPTELQLAAAHGLARSPRPATLAALGPMLDEPYEPEARRAAAGALAVLLGPSSAEPSDLARWQRWYDRYTTDTDFAAAANAAVEANTAARAR